MTELEQIAYANLIYAIIGAAHEVHKELHYGLSEAIYEECLCLELKALGLRAESQVELPVFYKGQLLEKHYRLDITESSRRSYSRAQGTVVQLPSDYEETDRIVD